MQRRAFLKLFGAASVATVAGVAVLDPDALLWRPGAKLISVPAPRLTSTLHTNAFLEVGDIVTFGDWPERYVVTEAVQSMEQVMDARFACIDQLPRMWPPSTRRMGDTVFRNRFREMMNLAPGDIRSIRSVARVSTPQAPYRAAYAIQPCGPRS